ncbi:putative Neoverrucotoxin subunit beta protein, partial [Naja naja]
VTLWLSSEGSDEADGSLEGGNEGESETGSAINAQAQPRDKVELLDYDSLKKDLTIKPQPKIATEIIASDTIDDKSSALDISAPLKASFLGRLVEKSKQQARVTLQYKTTTKYEQLTMSHLGRDNVTSPAVFEQGTATHMVTAIFYGSQAFFVFDQEVSS